MNKPVAMLNDTTRCTGCERCVDACKELNGLGPDLPRRWKRRIDDLSSTRYTTVLTHQDENIRLLCRHCREPACVSACLVGALSINEFGAVTYDPDRCMGCRYCMMSCPFGIPRYAWEDPIPTVRKCHLCTPRLEAGSLPACADACPHEAILVGSREELIAEAQSRIEGDPSRYFPKIFGEEEVGGTSILYVSGQDLSFLAYGGELPERPLPELTWAALSKVPTLAAGVGGGMTLLWWIIQRRMKLEGEKGQKSVEEDGQ